MSFVYANDTLKEAKDLLQEGEYKRAFNLLHPLAQKNNPEAQLLIVEYYKKRSDLRSAIHWLERASKNNVAKADLELGKIYSAPPVKKGISYDPIKAKNHFEKAAKSGIAEAQFHMAMFNKNDHTNIQKWDLVTYWLRLAAEQDHAPAMYQYGLLFLNGTGVKKNKIRGVRLIGQAALKGHNVAEFEYATKVFQGIGVNKNHTIAANWFKIASHKGNPLAQQRLAILYMIGFGVEKNLEEAVVWHLITKQNPSIDRIIANTSNETKKYIDKLENILANFSATKRLELRHIASNFKPLTHNINHSH